MHEIGGEQTKVDRKRLHHQSVSVIPDYDPIAMVDSQSGMIQRIQCSTSHLSMQLSCHMIESALCELIQHCGDHRSRFANCTYEHSFSSLLLDTELRDIPPNFIGGVLVILCILFSMRRYKQTTNSIQKCKAE